jgi:hypothetical protein
MPPRSATSITGRWPHSANEMSLTGWLKPWRAMSLRRSKKSGRRNSRRTSLTSKPPSGPSRTDHTALRLSSSEAWFQVVCPKAGLDHTA